MTTLAMTVASVFGFTTPAGPYQSGDSTPQQELGCFIMANFTTGDTYAQADDATISGVATAIQNARRNGKTVTLIGAATVASGLETATQFGLGMPTSFASGTIVAPVTGADLTTEHAGAAMGTCNRPVCLAVGFKEV